MHALSAPSRVLVTTLAALLTACASGGRSAGSSAASTSTVTSQEIDQTANTPIEDVLRGRIAGVSVSRAQDGGLFVRVRGSTSFNSSEAPLYVVDGVALQPSPSGSLQGINVYDIESIRVLKDPASLTMYGSRGANGVIVIKTKTAGKR
jgi:TonB-dependent SusC/RagA subfamily outer membrane receptor